MAFRSASPSRLTTVGPRVVEYRRPWLYPAQLAAIFHDQRYGLIEASTKSGKTIGCIFWLAEQAMRGKAGQNFWWVAPVSAQAQIAFVRLRQGMPRTVYRAIESPVPKIMLANGATIWFRSAENPDNLFGEDVHAAVIDEASRCREESWHAVRTTLTATRGPLRIIGNVTGRKNWFYRMARRAEAGEPGTRYAKIIAADAIEAGLLTAAEIEDARQKLPDAVFRELYLAEASDDEGNPFGVAAIRACIAPLSEGPADAWGWDLAKSVDWTVGVALDSLGRCCGFERFQAPWQETIARVRLRSGATRMLVDSTGVGDPIVEALQRAEGGRGQVEGFKFSATSKQQLMEGLSVAIQQRSVTYPDGPIVAELEAFEYVYSRTGVRYSGPEGMHDDCVVALALAVHRRRGEVAEPRIRRL